MDILNKKERNSAFIMFLLMFVVTTGVLIFALFFDFRLPLKENEVLKSENEKIVKNFNYQKEFSEKYQHICKLIDSLDKTPEQFPYLEQTISSELVDLQKKADSLEVDSKLYGNVILYTNKLVQSKKVSTQTNDSQGTIDKLTEENKTLENKSNDLSMKLQICEQINKN
ncbi:type VI secretion system TssO [Flavobacterium sp.]|uniref:type VI secretion system TssO n=1 Tax=Flavobacterium sp. TaxID=239 RepID=UPI00286E08FA|nr:type VI secretion system TssO [Flavobacterium sp.]